MTKKLSDRQKIINKLVRDAFRRATLPARIEQRKREARLCKWLVEVQRAEDTS